MNDRVRIYKGIGQVWTHTEERNGRETEIIVQFEALYKEYSLEDGSLVGEGSEDFSTKRYESELQSRFVWVWDGRKRNKGGCRWFDCKGDISFPKGQSRLVKDLLKKKYDAEEVQLRA